MSKRKKINRGFILTLFVLICVIIYLVVMIFVTREDVSEIKRLSEEYIAAELKYNMLPEEYRKQNPEIPDDTLSAYIDEMKSTLKSYYIDNEQSYKYLLENIESSLKTQADGYDIIEEYSKDIIKISVSIDDDIASVSISNTTKYSTLSGSDSDSSMSDSLIFQKVNGSWRLTYSSLTKGYFNDSSKYATTVIGGEY